jgi:sigma-B regulation protein RsbU (phosphoserine phosphatase)
MLLLRNGGVTEIAENGLLLAAVDGVSYADTTNPLEAGDRLLLYTDGLVEARNRAGEMFGDAALIAKLRHTGEIAPAEAADSIIAAVQGWAHSQDDDLTVLICDYISAD